MVILLLSILVGSILIGWLVPLAFKSPRPYGLVGDILFPTIIALLWAFIIYQFLAPMVNLVGPLKFFGTLLESLGVAAVVLWILRRIKR